MKVNNRCPAIVTVKAFIWTKFRPCNLLQFWYYFLTSFSFCLLLQASPTLLPQSSDVVPQRVVAYLPPEHEHERKDYPSRSSSHLNSMQINCRRAQHGQLNVGEGFLHMCAKVFYY
eukprot:TRINITY_DN3025_c0_g2_i2.p1 TRINITY_DN3025_c0_g2~~TRINITY_DN3025_c0_g2_i2.p1  ORF type:complete len:116 (-),score=0.49 TRINITY_DN3025_c0_g2_i2:18-365(-)